eukprot:jgi/Bigna1/89173/estExt_fgenesh1_pg.C_450007
MMPSGSTSSKRNTKRIPSDPKLLARKKECPINSKRNSSVSSRPDDQTLLSSTSNLRYRGELSHMSPRNSLKRFVPAPKLKVKRSIKATSTASSSEERKNKNFVLNKGDIVDGNQKFVSEEGKSQSTRDRYILQLQRTRVDLSGKRISDDTGGEILMSLEGSLAKELYIYCNQLSLKSCRALANSLQSGCNLRVLLLGKNKISDNGAIVLSRGLRSNTKLECLGLDDNSIGDVGACHLAEALIENKNLKILDVDENHIALGENTSLLKLAVLKNPGSDEDMMREIKDCLKINKKLKRHNGKGSKQAFHTTLMNFE